MMTGRLRSSANTSLPSAPNYEDQETGQGSLTLLLKPRRTEFLSLSSISLSRIFLTISMSELSGTYFRFAGELERSPDFAAGVAVAATALRGGVPGGVVDSAAHKWISDES